MGVDGGGDDVAGGAKSSGQAQREGEIAFADQEYLMGGGVMFFPYLLFHFLLLFRRR